MCPTLPIHFLFQTVFKIVFPPYTHFFLRLTEFFDFWELDSCAKKKIETPPPQFRILEKIGGSGEGGTKLEISREGCNSLPAASRHHIMHNILCYVSQQLPNLLSILAGHLKRT